MSNNVRTFPDGSNGEIPMKPRSRTENFLGRIADNPYSKERTPKTRRERALNEIYKAMTEVVTNLAPAYDSTSTYEVGDYCQKDGVFYVCNTRITTAEVWNSEHWNQTTVSEALANTSDRAGFLCCNSRIPRDFEDTTTLEQADFYPNNARIGDYILGKNLCVGVVTGVSGDYLTVSSLGMSINEKDTIDISETTPTIAPVQGITYECGELSSLTVTNPPATGSYSIVFTSGSTLTTTTIPVTILGLEDFAAEANTIYEINVLDNRAVVGSWAVSSS